MATTATAIYPGAAMMLGNERVTIRQINNDGTILCLRARGPFRATPDQFAAIPEDASPTWLWLHERIDTRDPNVRTPMVDALEDFRVWASAHGLDDGEALSGNAFRRAVRAAGGKVVMKSTRIWGRWQRVLCLCGRLKGGR